MTASIQAVNGTGLYFSHWSLCPWFALPALILALPRWSGVLHEMAFSPDGRLLASGNADNTVQVWDAASGEQLRTLTHAANVCGVAFSPDGQLLASGTGNGGVYPWPLAPAGP
jgi:WD40 repeat protein